MKKKNKKSIILSIVAFILVLMVTVGATYAWIDDIKLVEFQNDDLTDNGAPLKTGVDINSTVNVTSDTNTIDLGNMLSQSDLMFDNYTYNAGEENEYTGKHTKYEGGSNAPDWNNINKEKGYFYESGDMHLSGCYSDGETFYFPTSEGSTSYREGNKDDENVNYISMTMKVSSPMANVDFWFRNLPTITKHDDSNTQIANARYAIIVDGETHVYSSSGTAKTCNANLNGTTNVQGVRKTSTYTYGNSENTTDERGANSNTLFSVNKGDTVNLTIKIWLENGFDTNITASDINFQLVSSWAYTRKITIVDKTTNSSGSSWINDDNAKLYVTCPEILNDYAKTIYNTNNPNVAFWSAITAVQGYDKAPFYQLTLDSGSTNSYSIDVPLAFNNEDICLYRCAVNGWNNGTHSGNSGDFGVTYWNWWKSTLPNTYKSETYTLYGSSLDNVAESEFSDVTANYKGYGTWGAVEEISVYSHYDDTDYASYGTDGIGSRLFIRDHSDESTSGEIYTYVMYRPDNEPSTPWKANVPASSSKIQFYYHYGGAKGTWGYRSWSDENPQRRPLASTGLYAENSKVYHFAQNYGGDKGWGYWEGADTVYLIKSGFLSPTSTTAHAYMFVGGTPKEAYPGETLTRLKYTNGSDVSYTWNGGTTTAEVWKTGSPRVYNKIIFNNGFGGDGNQTEDLNLFPGCFYQVDGNKWYGSLDDKGRTASTDTGGGDDSGSDTGGGTMDGYTTWTEFIFKIENTEYRVYSNAAGNSFKVRLNLSAGDNWTTVQKQTGTYPNYGNGSAGQRYEPSANVNLYLTTANNNNFSIRTSTSGSFIATFQYDGNNQNTIKITSILKED